MRLRGVSFADRSRSFLDGWKLTDFSAVNVRGIAMFIAMLDDLAD